MVVKAPINFFGHPEVNALTQKATSVPIFNPVNRYGRVFFFSWLGFMTAFLSWFAFPPLVSRPSRYCQRASRLFRSLILNFDCNADMIFHLQKLTITIKKDLNMTAADVANSNMVALLATYGAYSDHSPNCHICLKVCSTNRLMFTDSSSAWWQAPSVIDLDRAMCSLEPCSAAPSRRLWRGSFKIQKASLPSAFSSGYSAPALCHARCGALGSLTKTWSAQPMPLPAAGATPAVASFSMSLVSPWNLFTLMSSRADSLPFFFPFISFLMPAVLNSLVSSRGLSEHVAWRVAFIVPFILITAVATAMLLLCEDTPTGKWSERHLIIQGQPGIPPPESTITEPAVKGLNCDGSLAQDPPSSQKNNKEPSELLSPMLREGACKLESAAPDPNSEIVTTAFREVVVSPTLREALLVIFSSQSLALAALYACSFGEFTLSIATD